jgi:hypothetical protein
VIRDKVFNASAKSCGPVYNISKEIKLFPRHKEINRKEKR